MSHKQSRIGEREKKKNSPKNTVRFAVLDPRVQLHEPRTKNADIYAPPFDQAKRKITLVFCNLGPFLALDVFRISLCIAFFFRDGHFFFDLGILHLHVRGGL